MSHVFVILIIALQSAGKPAQSPPTAAASERPQTYAERYAVLSERNIFLRDRARPAPVQRTSTTQQSPRAPEQSFVLTGVVAEDGEFRAYVEDRGHGGMLRLSVGDAIARGRIVDIDIDAVAYESNGQMNWVNIGSDLTGSAAPGVAAMLSGPTSMPTNINPAILTLEERLKLRRQQELRR